MAPVSATTVAATAALVSATVGASRPKVVCVSLRVWRRVPRRRSLRPARTRSIPPACGRRDRQFATASIRPTASSMSGADGVPIREPAWSGAAARSATSPRRFREPPAPRACQSPARGAQPAGESRGAASVIGIGAQSFDDHPLRRLHGYPPFARDALPEQDREHRYPCPIA